MTTDLIDPLKARAREPKPVETAGLYDAASCPACGKAMRPVMSMGVPANACLDHRIVLPRLSQE